MIPDRIIDFFTAPNEKGFLPSMLEWATRRIRVRPGDRVEETSTLGEWILAHRRAVTFSAILILCGIVAMRIFVVGEWNADGAFVYLEFFRNLIDGLLSTVLVTAALATFFWWLRAPLTRTPVGGELFPDLISRKLEAAAKIADEWEYCGHTGRYVRARIVPILGASSKARSIDIPIRFIIINPANAALCAAYADYRSRSRSSTIAPRSWDTASVQADLLATIICLLQAKARFPRLKVLLGLAPHFGLWRFDRSNDVVIVTQEDPQQPAYRYTRGSRFFGYHRQECEEGWHQSVQHEILARAGLPLDETEIRASLNPLFGRGWFHLEPLLASALVMAAEDSHYA
ncbi:MAG: hypothetical protein QOJ27_133 [Sphingomonadales bacterium]|nr:hypothetical protein [Sphingomonadales bacterium]